MKKTMPKEKWTDKIPTTIDEEWQKRKNTERKVDLTWIDYFCDYDNDSDIATGHFKKYFYCVKQINDQNDIGASFETIRKMAIKLLELAPDVAVNSPGYGWPPGKPALLFGRAQGKFDAPKFALIFNPTNRNDDKKFYACFQSDTKEVNLNIDGLSGDIDIKTGWKRLANPIELTDMGELSFGTGGETSLVHLKKFLVDLNSFIGNNQHNNYLDNERPDGLGKKSPIYPKLIGRIETRIKPSVTEDTNVTIIVITPEKPTFMNLNTILFGPPGTGKTYHSSGKSLQLLNIKYHQNDAHQKFSSNCKDGKVVFTTFHQSYSYEDFIEGIRVTTNGNQVEYKIRNGLFKKIARKALFQKAAHLLGEAVNQEHLEKNSTTYAENLDKDLMNKNDFNSSEDVQETLKIIALLKSDPLKYCSDEIVVENQPRFVIVIDEINRGNISKIFGELITLIEDNKRLGGGDVLSVTLPYSGERFFVPDNLYILGTMNTADRSLAALDVALRRRFDFEEMMPNFDDDSPLFGIKVRGVEGVEGVDLCKWMTGVNQRIQAERGREFTIGHAFFMSLKKNPTMDELASIMQRKVLPLLEEYFFDDWEGIRFVLNETNPTGNLPCFIKTLPIITRKDKLVTLYGWNKTALTNPAAYR